jgi:hypothetical protein
LSKKLGLVLLLAVAVSLSLVSVAVAQSSSTNSSQQVYKAKLNPLNRSGASANATLILEGRRLTTKLESDDMAPKLPHAQHIHGFKQAVSECPTLAADDNGDRLVNTVEGLPSYGPIRVSFTTSGDTSPASGLAVDRFPVGEHDGDIHYTRTFRVPVGVAQRLGRMAIVQHGVDLNHNGRYDFKAAGKSELDPSLPQEATIPANCGVINPVR